MGCVDCRTDDVIQLTSHKNVLFSNETKNEMICRCWMSLLCTLKAKLSRGSLR